VEESQVPVGVGIYAFTVVFRAFPHFAGEAEVFDFHDAGDIVMFQRSDGDRHGHTISHLVIWLNPTDSGKNGCCIVQYLLQNGCYSKRAIRNSAVYELLSAAGSGTSNREPARWYSCLV